jgi:hypothetical protein
VGALDVGVTMRYESRVPPSDKSQKGEVNSSSARSQVVDDLLVTNEGIIQVTFS